MNLQKCTQQILNPKPQTFDQVFSRGASAMHMEEEDVVPISGREQTLLEQPIVKQTLKILEPGEAGKDAPHEPDGTAAASRQLEADLIGGGPTLGIGPVFGKGIDPREISPITISDLRHGLEILALGARFPQTLSQPGLALRESLKLCVHSRKGWTCRRAFNAWIRLHQVIFRAQVLKAKAIHSVPHPTSVLHPRLQFLVSVLSPHSACLGSLFAGSSTIHANTRSY